MNFKQTELFIILANLHIGKKNALQQNMYVNITGACSKSYFECSLH